ncbi:MAG: 50S ribosomal protein L6 [Deltaproteobacteria bacterium]|nr:50S ribosomal protein L6 [Deltaproteobacteria bacterium]
MSRVGKKPILIPDNVEVAYKENFLNVKGEKGVLGRSIHPALDLKFENKIIYVTVYKDDRISRSLQGSIRSIVANMVHGVSKGFERVLDINGIGYRATLKGNTITLNLGYSHPIDFVLPEGISATVDKKNSIKLAGIDKEVLGQTAASIRMLRPPEPYKGKGIKYAEEHIRRKAGKTGVK